jgi:hypothetical protein
MVGNDAYNSKGIGTTCATRNSLAVYLLSTITPVRD